MDSPSSYKSPTRFTVVKTYSPNSYKPPTGFAVVQTDTLIFYKPPTIFAVGKPTLRASTSHFVVVNTDPLSVLYALR